MPLASVGHSRLVRVQQLEKIVGRHENEPLPGNVDFYSSNEIQLNTNLSLNGRPSAYTPSSYTQTSIGQPARQPGRGCSSDSSIARATHVHLRPATIRAVVAALHTLLPLVPKHHLGERDWGRLAHFLKTLSVIFVSADESRRSGAGRSCPRKCSKIFRLTTKSKF